MRLFLIILSLLVVLFCWNAILEAEPFLVCDWALQDIPSQTIKYYIVTINQNQTFQSEPEVRDDGKARLHFDVSNLPNGEHRFDVSAVNVLNLASETVTYWCMFGSPKPPKNLKVE